MRYILKVVRAVEKVYAGLERDSALFNERSGLRCLSGCSACCLNPGIEASVLEMLPLAWHLYMHNRYREIMDLLEQDGPFCVLYATLDPGNMDGRCRFYDHRALICRLFGNSGIVMKNGERALYTCHPMKTVHTEAFQLSEKRINSGLEIPMASKYRIQLDSISNSLSSDINPVNQSIRKALEKVSLYFRINPDSTFLKKTGS